MARILIADEDAVAFGSLRAALSAGGHVVATAGDGEAAWWLLTSGAFDYAFFGLLMPRLNGIQLLKLVRRHRRFHRLPTGLITEHASMGTDLAEAEGLTVHAILTKPFDAGDVLHALALMRLGYASPRVLGRQDPRTAPALPVSA